MTGSYYIEQRRVGAGVALSWDIAHHLYARLLIGKAVVVSANPAGLRSAVSKQWLHILRHLHVQRASTLDADRIWELTQYVKQLESVTLSMHEPQAEVLFMTAQQCLANPPTRPTLYLTQAVDSKTVEQLTQHMPARSVVVLYS